MLQILKALFSSKKFLVMLAGIVLASANKLGLDLDPELVNQILALVGVYIVGQGIADRGKEAAKTSSALEKAGPALVLLVALAVISGGVASIGCNTLRDSGTRVADDIVDCGKAEAKDQIAAYGPAMAGMVLAAVDNRGKLDKEQLRPVGAALKSAAQRCVLAAAIAEVARRFAPKPDAPQSEGLTVDADAARADFAALSAELYGGQKFAVGGGVL